MSEQIREQISAFLDGELPPAETELLLKRLTRDAELRECFGRYALIGEACRSAAGAGPGLGFADKVRRVLEAEAPLPAAALRPPARRSRVWRHVASGAVAAGVAVIAVFALQQRANTPTLADLSSGQRPSTTVHAAVKYRARPTVVVAKTDHEALSYTVPTTLAETPAAMPPARLTNYVFAHSEYASFLGERSLLSGLIAEPDAGAGDVLGAAPAAPAAAAASIPVGAPASAAASAAPTQPGANDRPSTGVSAGP